MRKWGLIYNYFYPDLLKTTMPQEIPSVPSKISKKDSSVPPKNQQVDRPAPSKDADLDKEPKETKTIISTPHIYKPIAPLSQGVLADKTLYVSGIIGLDKDSNLVCGGAGAEMKQALANLKHVLDAGGACIESVIKTTLLFTDLQDFESVTDAYREYFSKDYPALTMYQVSRLQRGACVELEAVALTGDVIVAAAGPCPCTRK